MTLSTAGMRDSQPPKPEPRFILSFLLLCSTWKETELIAQGGVET